MEICKDDEFQDSSVKRTIWLVILGLQYYKNLLTLLF